jgi:hypothetical protein
MNPPEIELPEDELVRFLGFRFLKVLGSIIDLKIVLLMIGSPFLTNPFFKVIIQ